MKRREIMIAGDRNGGILLEESRRKYLTELEQTGTGDVQHQTIMNVLERIFQEEKAFLKFLQEFDVFVKKYQITEELLLRGIKG